MVAAMSLPTLIVAALEHAVREANAGSPLERNSGVGGLHRYGSTFARARSGTHTAVPLTLHLLDIRVRFD